MHDTSGLTPAHSRLRAALRRFCSTLDGATIPDGGTGDRVVIDTAPAALLAINAADTELRDAASGFDRAYWSTLGEQVDPATLPIRWEESDDPEGPGEPIPPEAITASVLHVGAGDADPSAYAALELVAGVLRGRERWSGGDRIAADEIAKLASASTLLRSTPERWTLDPHDAEGVDDWALKVDAKLNELARLLATTLNRTEAEPSTLLALAVLRGSLWHLWKRAATLREAIAAAPATVFDRCSASTPKAIARLDRFVALDSHDDAAVQRADKLLAQLDALSAARLPTDPPGELVDCWEAWARAALLAINGDATSPTTEAAAAREGDDSGDFRDAAWFSDATGGAVNADNLRRARDDGRIVVPRDARKVGKRWRYRISRVVVVREEFEVAIMEYRAGDGTRERIGKNKPKRNQSGRKRTEAND